MARAEIDILTEQERRWNRTQLYRYKPYPKQIEFHAAGLKARERLLMANSRFGKTLCGAAEMAYHLTGKYPDWWAGKRFDGPVRAWAAGVTNLSTRDILQEKLIGPPDRQEEWGTGMIPGDLIVGKPSMARGVADLMDTVTVKHASGGNSTVQFKSFEMGREKFQGTAREVIWLDEEGKIDIYIECVTRTNETNGTVFTTFTPLKGETELVDLFRGKDAVTSGRVVVHATLEDALHFTGEERADIIARTPSWELEARVHGLPALGSGRVFKVDEAALHCEGFEIPKHFAQIIGVDFGYDHPFAACRCAWDRDNDIFYVVATYRETEASAPIHAAAMRPWGTWVPIAWPHDGLQHDKGSGDQLASQYRDHGLNMLHEHATHEAGGNGVEAGVQDMLERMQTGRWKVFPGNEDWFGEFRQYHREDGKIVKLRDDLLSASRYALMMRRFAEAPPSQRRAVVQSGGRYGWMA